jgi:MFS transporter, NNP family, nitrate/nitrite transporter
MGLDYYFSSLKATQLIYPLQVPGKKYLTLACGAIQGVLSMALGFYIDSRKKPDRKLHFHFIDSQRLNFGSLCFRQVATVIGVMVVLAIFNEMGNGANFALVPHCNPCKGDHFMSEILILGA